MKVLPHDFDRLLDQAVEGFWSQRETRGQTGQEGGRGKVIGGHNMRGFADLVLEVARHGGLPPESVLVRKSRVILPGYFRATKNWDVLVVHRDRLLAAFEFKSQVGSFGNNFNNRAEEAVGSATDLWVANHEGAYGRAGASNDGGSTLKEEPALNPTLRQGGKPPFVGWLMLLEDCPDSMEPVSVEEPHFPVFPEFRGASYADRYRILCERLIERRLYDAAALVLSTRPAGRNRPAPHRSLSGLTSARQLFASFAGRLLGDLAGG